MQYKVPQNIDQEDKILGPMTFTQFLYALIGGGFLLLFFALFDFSLFLLVGIPTLVLTICFALIKVQDQPFSHFFTAFIVYLFQPKHRIWRDQNKPADLSAGLGKNHQVDVAHDLPPALPMDKKTGQIKEDALPPLPENISTSRKLAVKTAGNNTAAQTISVAAKTTAASTSDTSALDTSAPEPAVTTANTPEPLEPAPKTPRKLQINVLSGGA